MWGRPTHYILVGRKPQPVDPDLWWNQDIDIRRVHQEIIGRYWISTVFMGLDGNVYGEGPPLLFETEIFENENGERGQSVLKERTATWDEAERMHAICVETLKRVQP
jgi:hypothetical protein